MRARLGIFAMLLQAILFGWHHHELAFSPAGMPVSAALPSGDPTSPLVDADGCEICLTLHHQATAPAVFFVPAVSDLAAAPRTDRAVPFPARSALRAFDSRAPPRV